MPYTLCLPNRASLQQRKSILPFPWPTISCPAVSSHHCFSPGRSALSHSQGKVCISLLIFRDWEHSHGTANTKYQSSDIIQLYRYCKRHTWTRNSWKKVCSTQTKLPGARTKLDPGSWPSTAPAPAPAPPRHPHGRHRSSSGHQRQDAKLRPPRSGGGARKAHRKSRASTVPYLQRLPGTTSEGRTDRQQRERGGDREEGSGRRFYPAQGRLHPALHPPWARDGGWSRGGSHRPVTAQWFSLRWRA